MCKKIIRIFINYKYKTVYRSWYFPFSRNKLFQVNIEYNHQNDMQTCMSTSNHKRRDTWTLLPITVLPLFSSAFWFFVISVRYIDSICIFFFLVIIPTQNKYKSKIHFHNLIREDISQKNNHSLSYMQNIQ